MVQNSMDLNQKLFPLFRYYVVVSGIAITVATALLTYDHFRTANNELLLHTGMSNQALAQSFANSFWPNFDQRINRFVETGEEPSESHPLTRSIDDFVRTVVARTPILKVKVYGPNGITIYSSEPSQIALDVSENPNFKSVLEKQISLSTTSFRDQFWSFDGQVQDRHLVETYHPILNENQNVGAIFEVYRDVTHEYDAIFRDSLRTGLTIFSLLFLLYVILSFIVYRADKTIKNQYIAIKKSSSDLEKQTDNLRQAKEDAQAASRAKSEFLAAMSHEIRTPMTGVSGFADLLLEEALPSQSREKVQKIKSSANALLTIINDILDISKIDAGKLEIERINFRPANIANEVKQLFDETCPPHKKKQLSIILEVADDFPSVVCADPSRLRQILINLMGNAVKFTHEGSVRLLCEKAPNGQSLKFSVTDTGIGIDEATQERLFDDFVQADASVSRKYQGSGLGLAICNRLVGIMNGQIGLISKPGEGSTFWFTLPYEAPKEGEAVYEEQWSRKVVLPSVRTLDILVAEDNLINQTIVQAILERMGHRPTFVDNGLKAIDAIKATDFDVVLMDVRMPELSGPEATRQIRLLPSEKSKIPIIALTADIIAENQKTYFEAGMNDCVGKPINLEELAAALNKAMGETVNAIALDEETEESSFNLSEVESRLGLDADELAPVFQQFADEYRTVDRRLTELSSQEDLTSIYQLAHALKGASSSLGIYELAKQAERLESEAKAGDFLATKTRIDELKTEIFKAIKEIDNRF